MSIPHEDDFEQGMTLCRQALDARDHQLGVAKGLLREVYGTVSSGALEFYDLTTVLCGVAVADKLKAFCDGSGGRVHKNYLVETTTDIEKLSLRTVSDYLVLEPHESGITISFSVDVPGFPIWVEELDLNQSDSGQLVFPGQSIAIQNLRGVVERIRHQNRGLYFRAMIDSDSPIRSISDELKEYFDRWIQEGKGRVETIMGVTSEIQNTPKGEKREIGLCQKALCEEISTHEADCVPARLELGQIEIVRDALKKALAVDPSWREQITEARKILNRWTKA